MPRLVKRTLQGPTRYIIEGQETWLCKCGLSKNQPYCDSSHKLTRGEEPGKLYWYDDAGQRHEVADNFAEIRTF
jgi:CDGSH-type Zn-finger protein